MPESASAGDIIELKVMIQHTMETGYRRDAMGEPIARDILKKFECRYLEQAVFSCELFPAIAANPLLVFRLRVKRSGSVEFIWTDQHGKIFRDQRMLSVN